MMAAAPAGRADAPGDCCTYSLTHQGIAVLILRVRAGACHSVTRTARRPASSPRAGGWKASHGCRRRRQPPAEQHGRGGVKGAGAAPGRNQFAPCLHSVHMPSSLVCFWFALGLIWVYIFLCKPSKLCKLLMSKLCKLRFAQSLSFVCTKFTKFAQNLHKVY